MLIIGINSKLCILLVHIQIYHDVGQQNITLVKLSDLLDCYPEGQYKVQLLNSKYFFLLLNKMK